MEKLWTMVVTRKLWCEQYFWPYPVSWPLWHPSGSPPCQTQCLCPPGLGLSAEHSRRHHFIPQFGTFKCFSFFLFCIFSFCLSSLFFLSFFLSLSLCFIFVFRLASTASVVFVNRLSSQSPLVDLSELDKCLSLIVVYFVDNISCWIKKKTLQ